MHTNRNTHSAMLNERKNFQMNYIEQLVELGIGTALITIIVFMLAVSQIWNIFNNFCDAFGFETKWSRKRKAESSMLLKHEEKLNSIMTHIKEIKEANKADTKVTRDKFNVLSQMLQEIEQKMDNMEERRNNARRETLKQQLYNLYYKYKERAEDTGEMVLSKCEYEQFWTAFREYESEPLNGNGLIHSVVEIYMRGFISEE